MQKSASLALNILEVQLIIRDYLKAHSSKSANLTSSRRQSTRSRLILDQPATFRIRHAQPQRVFLAAFLDAFSVPGVGLETARLSAAKFRSLRNLQPAPPEETGLAHRECSARRIGEASSLLPFFSGMFNFIIAAGNYAETKVYFGGMMKIGFSQQPF